MVIKRLFTISVAVMLGVHLHAEVGPGSRMVFPDVPRSVERVKAGPYGKIWDHDDFAPLRALVQERLTRSLQGRYAEVQAALADLRSVVVLGNEASGASAPALCLHLPTQQIQAAALLGSLLPGVVGSAAHRSVDDWLIYGHGGRDTEVPTVSPNGEDLLVRMDLATLAQRLKVAPEVDAVLRELGLATMAYRMRFDEEGTRDEVEIPGCQPPLMAIDQQAFAVLPDGVLMLGALGVAGGHLHGLLGQMGKRVPAFAEHLARLDRLLAGQGAAPLAALLTGWKGTLWFAVASGAPFPTVTIGLPRSAEVDDLVLRLGAAWMADLSVADDRPVSFPLPSSVPLLVQIRRTATQWVVSSDPRTMERIASGIMRDVHPQIPAGTVAFFTQDNSGLVRTGMGFLPLVAPVLTRAVAKSSDDAARVRSILTMTVRSLNATLPHLPATRVVVQQDAQGVRVHGANAAFAFTSMALAGVSGIAIWWVGSEDADVLVGIP